MNSDMLKLVCGVLPVYGRYDTAERRATLAAWAETTRWIMEWRDPDDDPVVPPITEATWARAVEWIANLLLIKPAIPLPTLSPSSHGRIDMLWKTAAGDVLLCFPAVPDVQVSYYADNTKGEYDKGTFLLPDRLSSPITSILLYFTRGDTHD